MKISTKVLAVATAIGAASIVSTANAWWVPFFDDGYGNGNGNMSFNMNVEGNGYGRGDYDRNYYEPSAYRTYHRPNGPATRTPYPRDRAPIARDGVDGEISAQAEERVRYAEDRYAPNRYYDDRGYGRGNGRMNGGFSMNMDARGDGYGYDRYYNDRAYDARRPAPESKSAAKVAPEAAPEAAPEVKG